MAQAVFKNRAPKRFSIDIPLCKILEKYSDDTSIPESRVIDKALKEYFENHNIS